MLRAFREILVVFIICSVSHSTSAQKIVLDKEGLSFNGRSIATAQDLLKQLGEPDSLWVKSKAGTRVEWYYKYGLRVIHGKDGKKSVFEFRFRPYEDNPAFSGKLFLGKDLVEQGLHIYRLMQFSELEINEKDFKEEYESYMIDGEVAGIRIYFTYMTTKYTLNSVSIYLD